VPTLVVKMIHILKLAKYGGDNLHVPLVKKVIKEKDYITLVKKRLLSCCNLKAVNAKGFYLLFHYSMWKILSHSPLEMLVPKLCF